MHNMLLIWKIQPSSSPVMAMTNTTFGSGGAIGCAMTSRRAHPCQHITQFASTVAVATQKRGWMRRGREVDDTDLNGKWFVAMFAGVGDEGI
jgi:hypothetical protein